MSQPTSTPQKRKSRIAMIKKPQDSNHEKNKFTERQQAKNFVAWYKQMIDNERQNIGLYLSDDAILEWFGRTIKTRKKVATFLKHDMHCTRHDFVSIKNIDKIQSRQDRAPRNEEHNLMMRIMIDDEVNKIERIAKKRNLRSNCNSPEWAEGCQPPDEMKDTESKKLRLNNVDPSKIDSKHEEVPQKNGLKRGFNAEDSADANCKGDGVLDRRVKRRCEPVTPPNCEMGQGDCVPSTSGTDSDRSHDALNAQLPKLCVECNGYIQFTRTRNSHSNDAMNWERKCKVQISFSEDPLNIGEYIVWAICYTDDSKCRRNLLSAFEEVAIEEIKKNNNID